MLPEKYLIKDCADLIWQVCGAAAVSVVSAFEVTHFQQHCVQTISL